MEDNDVFTDLDDKIDTIEEVDVKSEERLKTPKEHLKKTLTNHRIGKFTLLRYIKMKIY